MRVVGEESGESDKGEREVEVEVEAPVVFV